MEIKMEKIKLEVSFPKKRCEMYYGGVENVKELLYDIIDRYGNDEYFDFGLINANRCENTDCEGDESQVVKKVMLKEGFGYDICMWCEDCIERDKGMIKRICNADGQGQEIK
jgi:hypothetical protein